MSTNGVSGPEPAATVTATLAIPRDAIRVIAPPPDTISQRNVEAVTGIPARVFLEAVRAPSFPLPVARLGKLRIVKRSTFVTWLERGASIAASAAPSDPDPGTPIAPEDAAPPSLTEHTGDILDALGLHSETTGNRKRARRKPR
ncbi:hypothetical protein [Polyangium aurulentum]|uniref:hypothetical protein n=1 Tax=Polyangium aurulentum TaxID=2567896 RepID=UPI0010AED185|nr:hypothetical protein [Polyangium aurulentum]UQA59983.1 hypothetical protein E8A73_005685 [Polyangium aurulentum]